VYILAQPAAATDSPHENGIAMYLTVDNKKTYAYTANRAFDASKPTVVFIHGAANDHSVWTLQSRYYAYHGWNAFAVDLPAHGKSAGTAYRSVGDLAAWIMRLLDAAGADKAALVGHSMGSLVALETAARNPQRIRKLAMIGTSVPIQVSEPLLNASKANDHVAYEMINAYAHSNAAQIGGNRVPGNDYVSGMAAAQDVKCPVLLVLGKGDLMTPAKVAKELAGKLSNVKVVTLDGTGHSVMAERPDDVLDSLIAFLD
jgi:pimeloyl-ACP methyl ester carboxylesterase